MTTPLALPAAGPYAFQPPGICPLPAAGRYDDLPHRFRQAQTVLTGCHRSSNSVSLILVRAYGHVIKPQGCQSLPSPGRAGPGASPAVPASPRGSWEDFDGHDAIGGERIEQSTPLEDPGVVGACVKPSFIRCPADAADRPGELALAVAGGLSVGCAAARAVYRDDRRPALHEKANNLPTRQAALERHNLAMIDDRDIEALPLSADINAGPRSHASKHARLQYRPHAGGYRPRGFEVASRGIALGDLQDLPPLGRSGQE
jgi:hypothetical protein